jgi:GTP 3',8-cyclase
VSELEPSSNADDAELFELVRLVHEETGIYKLRLSGGEPLLHPRVADVTARLRSLLPNARLALTTNGRLLAAAVEPLAKAGLNAINISLDSLDPDRFRDVTGGGDLEATLGGIHAAVAAGFSGVKINTVLIRRINGDQLPDLIRYAVELDCEIRFIELMPFGHGAALSRSDFLPADEALESLKQAFRYMGMAPSSGTATRHQFLVDGRPAVVGMITPVSHPFCSRCDRLRLSRTGRLYACLREPSGVELLPALRAGDEQNVRQRVRDSLRDKHDPGQHWPERHMVTIGG